MRGHGSSLFVTQEDILIMIDLLKLCTGGFDETSSLVDYNFLETVDELLYSSGGHLACSRGRCMSFYVSYHSPTI